jgi:hypothetical protein
MCNLKLHPFVCDEVLPERNGAGLFDWLTSYRICDAVQFSELEKLLFWFVGVIFICSFDWHKAKTVQNSRSNVPNLLQSKCLCYFISAETLPFFVRRHWEPRNYQ